MRIIVQSAGKNTHMSVLIVLFVLLFLLLLFSMPLLVEARARAGVRGVAVRARVYVLGLIPIPIRLRIRLFSEPYFTLEIGRRRVPLRGKRAGGGLPEGVRILRLETRTTVGITGEPAVAVRIAGTVAVLFGMLTTRLSQSGAAKAALSQEGMLRLSARANAIVFPPQLLSGIVKRRRIAKRKAANNSRKTNEKRTEYASC